jgi:ATP-dependent DNA helicase RecG
MTPDNFEPNPKNPIIAAFFRNIGFADELGSGVRKLYKYVIRYSGKDPQLIDGDVFRTIVPLDDEYSYDSELSNAPDKAPDKASGNAPDKAPDKAPDSSPSKGNLSLLEKSVLEFFAKNPSARQEDAVVLLGSTRRYVQKAFASLKAKGLISRKGSKKNGVWIVKDNNEDPLKKTSHD